MNSKNDCKDRAKELQKIVYRTFTTFSLISNYFLKEGYKCSVEISSKIENILLFRCSISRYFWFSKDDVLFSLDITNETITLTKDGSINIGNYAGIINVFQNNLLKFVKLVIKADEIVFDRNIIIHSDADATFISRGNIKFLQDGAILKKGNGALYLKAGIENDKSKVIFSESTKPSIKMEDNGKLVINYHPEPSTTNTEYQHKYHNSYSYSKHVEPSDALTAYMLVNNIQDLQGVTRFLHGDYALSQDIDAAETKSWNGGKGFNPVKLNIHENPTPFSGNFEGNGFKVANLYINRPDEDFVGLFGLVKGYSTHHTHIKNFNLINSNIIGNKYVGGIAGYAQHTIITGINEDSINVAANELAGGIVGSGQNIQLNQITCDHMAIKANEFGAKIAGAIKDFSATEIEDCCVLGDNHSFTEDFCFAYIANLL